VAIVVACCLSASALPIKPKAEDVLKDATKPRHDYPVARVGWDAPRPAQSHINPIYEQMRYPYTREGLFAQFVTSSTPDWRIFSLFALLIFVLRYYRYRAPKAQPAAIAVRTVDATLPAPAAADDTLERAA
jgi:hypothetical protein